MSNQRLITDLRKRQLLHANLSRTLKGGPHYDEIGHYSRRSQGHYINDLEGDVSDQGGGLANQIGQNSRLHQMSPDYDEGLMTCKHAKSHIDVDSLNQLKSTGEFMVRRMGPYRYKSNNAVVGGIPDFAFVEPRRVSYGSDLPLQEKFCSCGHAECPYRRKLERYHDAMMFGVLILVLWLLLKESKKEKS